MQNSEYKDSIDYETHSILFNKGTKIIETYANSYGLIFSE